MSIITLEQKVLEKNDEVAKRNRELFQSNKLLVLNLVSSPGSGKTSLLEQTLQRLVPTIRVAVIEGDVQTDLDAQRVAQFQVPVVQLVTQGSCHLNAKNIEDAIQHLELSKLQILFVENVGNLVCPATFDLGEDMKVVVISVTEGDDKPLKYPAMFQQASVLIINKTDLLPYVSCNIEVLRSNALRINPTLRVFEISCTTGAGIEEWCTWLHNSLKS